jgi:uncharacterized membrane protein YheB (UPF0754 family)
MFLLLCVIPLITAFAGWLAVFVASKLAFHPRQPKAFGFWIAQGAVPKHRNFLVAELSALLLQHVPGTNDLQTAFETIDVRPQVTVLLNGRIDTVLEKFVTKTPMAAMFLTDSVKATIKDLVVSEVVSDLPEIQKKLAQEAMGQFDLGYMLKQKLSQVDWDSIETQMEQAAAQHLTPASWLGAAIGWFVGLIQLIIVWVYLSLS